MGEPKKKQIRTIDAPFVAPGPSGAAVRDRLKHLTDMDDKVLRLVGQHLGRLASLDLKSRCAEGLDHNSDTWAARKQGLTADSSSRWAGSITKATHDQWALSRRCQLAHVQGLEAGVRTLKHRLSQPVGEKGTKLPAPLVHLANSKHGRYVLATRVRFQHRGAEWRDRIEDNRAVAYRIHLDVERGRWYLTASWTRPVAQTIPLQAARSEGMAGVDTNADHFAAEKTREKHGRGKRFRQLISGIPTGKLKARLVSMAAGHGLSIVAVDPAYTSMWGNQRWKKRLTSKNRKMSRHDAAGIAIGRRALGHPIRRRTAPPPQHQSDAAGHRTARAGPGTRGREGTRPPVTERAHDARSRTGTQRTRETSASNTVRDARGSGNWQQMPLLDTVQER
ncbi:transposase [Streptomyces sp. NPDC054796]